MSFSEILSRVVEEADGAIGAAVVANDGIVVEEYKKDPSLDLYLLGAEFCKTFKEFKEKTASMQKGAPIEFSVMTESAILVFKKINADYFLVLFLGAEGNFGKSRFLMKREMDHLLNEFK
jgi:predicted regulator of Ras-like GTPase activity (Roadblock/LC7/MglB family)